MRLRYCYVESFGVIRKRRIDLGGDIVSVCEENGYGKTTLAVFLKAVFYGMDSDRANLKGFCERRHYLPFEGGRYGGYVVFERGGSEYRIERYFDERSETRDSVAVYRDGREVAVNDAQRVGEEIFGIDRASFERTMFINDDDVEIAATSSINAKLTSFVEGGKGCDAESALAALDRKAKEYRKSRPGNDLISNTTGEMYSLSRRIEDVNRVCSALPGLYAEYDSLMEERRRLEGDLGKAHGYELEMKDWERLDSLRAEADDAGAEADGILRRFPSGIPAEDEIVKAEACLTRESALGTDFGARLGEDDVARLRELDSVFSSGVPDGGTLSGMDSLIAERAALEAEAGASGNLPVTDRYAELSRRFSGNVPDGRTLGRLDEAAEAYEKAELGCAGTPELARGATAARGSSRKAHVAAAVVAGAVTVSGIGVVFANIIAGIVLLLAGVLGLAVDAFVFLCRRQNASFSGGTRNPGREKAEKDLAVAEKAVRNILKPYGYGDDGSVRYAVETFRRDLDEFLACSGAMEARRGEASERKERLSGIDERLDAFFARYGMRDGDYRDRMSRLRGDVSEYMSLAETEKRYGAGNMARTEALSANSVEISAFCSRYGFSATRLRDDLPLIKRDAAAYRDAVRRHDAGMERAETFRRERNLVSRPLAPVSTGSETQGAINELNARLDRLSREIDECESSADTLDGLNAELQRLTELLDEYTEDHKILTAAASFISEADRNLRDRSFAPIRDGFSRYADMLERAVGERMVMKPDFELVYESCGSERSDRHLSSGQRSICALCFRVALIENMYRDDRPFVILDDPFVHLDAKHFAKVKTMLKGLSKDIQIIYFTCHQSRSL